MTREEAIEILKAHHMWTGEPQEIIDVRKENKALEMAIQALSQEPTVTSTDEPMTMVYPTIFCEDVISINAVDRFGVLNEIYEWTISGEYEQPRGTDILIKRINNMPSVQPKSIECEDAISREAVIKLFNGNIGSEAALILHKVKQLPPVSTTKNIVNHGTMNITL